MEFEIKDIQMIDSENGANAAASSITHSEDTSTPKTSNSLILNELSKENEDLQNKLKLNYRRMLLFETENQKLLEEKNKLFFEAQTYMQKYQILLEKNEELEKQNILTEQNYKLANEKSITLEKVNSTQLAEIKRYSKFHQKINDVVKPYIVALKKQIADLKVELIQTQKLNTNLTTTCKELDKRYELDTTQKNNEILSLTAEKNSMMQTYEEQIHSFSKEIIDLQTKNEDFFKEIGRLKKAVEFKNYFENEVIRFKRTHEDDQFKIAELGQKKSAAETKIMHLEQTTLEAKAEATQLKTKMSELETSLEVARTQLSKKIDEVSLLNERLGRLEKLNIQLSQQMVSKQS